VGSAGYTFPGGTNIVTINFGATNTRAVRLNVTANTGWPAAQISEFEIYGATGSTGNLSLGKTLTSSSVSDVYVAGNANDANQATYWESANNAFPQWIQVDLTASLSVNRVVVKLPSGWGTRTQTLVVRGSSDGTNFTDIVASAGYEFTPATSNTVTISFNAATTRYLRLHITANTGWPAAQVSEFEVYGSGSGDTQPPSAPTNLAYTQPASGQICLAWTASTDNVGVTGYDVYANNVLRSSVTGNVLTYTDTQPDTYFVRAGDAAGNQSANSNSVTRTGTGGGGGANLAVNKPIVASSTVFTYVAANANDNDLATYWESAAGAYPATLTVQLGANATVNSVVVKLNPDPAWGARTQTIQVLGREQSATTFASLSPATVHTFNPASGNTVTIAVSGTVADVRLQVTSNSGAPGAHVSEFQVIGTPAANPDLVVTGVSTTPAAPTEANPISVSTTVKNQGTAASGATNVTLYLGATLVATMAVGGLAAGASARVSAPIGHREAGTHTLVAKVDEANTVIELDDGNNNFSTSLVVTPVASSDLVAAAVGWTPNNPANGTTVTFSVRSGTRVRLLRPQGHTASR
jgi:hypothetical protein